MPFWATSTRWRWQERFDRLVLLPDFDSPSVCCWMPAKGGYFRLAPAGNAPIKDVRDPDSGRARASIAATPTGDITFLSQSTANGFGNWFRDGCNDPVSASDGAKFIAGLGSAAVWPMTARAQQGDQVHCRGWPVKGCDTFTINRAASCRSYLPDAKMARVRVVGNRLSIGHRSLDVGVTSLTHAPRVGQVKLECSPASTTPNARRCRR
jgi:hypothetical protein